MPRAKSLRLPRRLYLDPPLWHTPTRHFSRPARSAPATRLRSSHPAPLQPPDSRRSDSFPGQAISPAKQQVTPEHTATRLTGPLSPQPETIGPACLAINPACSPDRRPSHARPPGRQMAECPTPPLYSGKTHETCTTARSATCTATSSRPACEQRARDAQHHPAAKRSRQACPANPSRLTPIETRFCLTSSQHSGRNRQITLQGASQPTT